MKPIIDEGEKRYNKFIPPGFRDANKEDVADNTRKYGDLLIWKQLMYKALSEKKGIIFVCDDRKDDWWLEFRGKRIGPRPELIKEFKNVTENDFYMYSSDCL